MPLAWPSLFDFIAKRQRANPYNEAITGPLQFPTPRSVQPCRALTEEIMSVNGDKQIIYRNYTKVPRKFTVCEGVLAIVGPASANTRRETLRTWPSRALTAQEFMFANGDRQIIYRNYTKVPRKFTVCEGVVTIGPALASTRRETRRTRSSKRSCAQSSPPSTKRKRG
jgi:hypothetical protein